jgi:hypothetical protein
MSDKSGWESRIRGARNYINDATSCINSGTNCRSGWVLGSNGRPLASTIRDHQGDIKDLENDIVNYTRKIGDCLKRAGNAAADISKYGKIIAKAISDRGIASGKRATCLRKVAENYANLPFGVDLSGYYEAIDSLEEIAARAPGDAADMMSYATSMGQASGDLLDAADTYYAYADLVGAAITQSQNDGDWVTAQCLAVGLANVMLGEGGASISLSSEIQLL